MYSFLHLGSARDYGIFIHIYVPVLASCPICDLCFSSSRPWISDPGSSKVCYIYSVLCFRHVTVLHTPSPVASFKMFYLQTKLRSVLFHQNLMLENRKILCLLFWFIFLLYHINRILHYQLVCTILLQSITMKIRQKVFGDNKLLC